MYAHIARQPIFNLKKQTIGYELLYRDGVSGNMARIVDGDAATRSVLSDAVTVFGISRLTNHLRAYVNFTENLILDDFAYLADPKEIVIEIEEDIRISPELIDKLGDLKTAGYSLSLGSYTGAEKCANIMHFFDVAKVNVQKVDRLHQRMLAHNLKHMNVKMLAERVETEEDFTFAANVGFVYFQGYYFEKPKVISQQVPPLALSSYGRLLNVLQDAEPDFDACTEIIQSDAVLTYLFLRQMQTANYYRGNLINEIRNGIVMMGTAELRRWLLLVLVRQTNVTHSDELPRKAYLRGRFIEELMKHSVHSLDSKIGFLLGMFSMLDRILGVSMFELLSDLKLDDALKDTLLGTGRNELSVFLQYAIMYELSNPNLVLPDIHLKVDDQEVARFHMKCIEETDRAFNRVGGQGK